MSFSNVALVVIFNLVRAYVNSGIFDRIEDLVRSLIEDDRPGSAKKQMVIDFAVSELKLAPNGLLPAKWKMIIDLIIAVTRLRYEAE